jgi:DMSO reductase family type II enzyme chaperone
MTAVRLEGLRTQEELAAATRSSIYRRLAEAFAFPSAALVEAVTSGSLLAELQSEATALAFDLPLDEEAQAALADPAVSHDELQQQYIRLFEVGPGRPPCPLYEGSHRTGRMKIMEELVRFYEHFGLRAEAGDQPDHLCCQLEFMHYLAFKEAAALSNAGPTAAFVLAQRDFLSRHLCLWLPRLRARLEGQEPPPFYRSLARLAEAFVAGDVTELKGRQAKPDTEIVPLPD